MTLATKTFALALALAAVPTASLADGRDDDRDRNAPVAAPAPSPYPGERDRDRDYRWQDRDDRWQDRDGRWQRDPDDRFDRWSGRERWSERWSERRMVWRLAEWRDLRRDFWELEQQRGAFYAYRRHPKEVRRFERWYAMRRTELEHRRDALFTRAYAWR